MSHLAISEIPAHWDRAGNSPVVTTLLPLTPALLRAGL